MSVVSDDEIVMAMDPGHLIEEELDYEIELRKDLGVLPSVKRSNKAIQLENQLIMDVSKHLRPEDRLKECTDEERATEVELLRTRVDDLLETAFEYTTSSQNTRTDWYATISRLVHHEHRLGRMVSDDEEVNQDHQNEIGKLIIKTLRAKKLMEFLLMQAGSDHQGHNRPSVARTPAQQRKGTRTGYRSEYGAKPERCRHTR